MPMRRNRRGSADDILRYPRYRVPVVPNSSRVLGLLVVLPGAVLIAGCTRSPASDPSSVSSSVSTSRIGTAAGYFVVQGAILEKYQDADGPNGWLGEPTSSERVAPHGGRFNEFQHGSIYWTPRTGAHSIAGQILWAWNTDGGPAGSLGYPTSDGHPVAGGTESRFERGTITDVGGHAQIRPDIAGDDGD
jgi:uncharacterized protein with LGFP repeats